VFASNKHPWISRFFRHEASACAVFNRSHDAVGFFLGTFSAFPRIMCALIILFFCRITVAAASVPVLVVVDNNCMPPWYESFRSLQSSRSPFFLSAVDIDS
jgi:hypothetical protein